MVVEVATWIDLFAPVREMRVLAILLRTTARKVLGHRRDRFRPELLTLESADVCLHQLAGEVCIFTETAVDPRPPGLCSKVNLGVQRKSEAYRQCSCRAI